MTWVLVLKNVDNSYSLTYDCVSS